MKAAIRDAQQLFPELSEGELVALTLWKLRYVLMREGHDKAEATALARLTFERQFADVPEINSTANVERDPPPTAPSQRTAFAVAVALIAAFLGLVFAAPGRS